MSRPERAEALALSWENGNLSHVIEELKKEVRCAESAEQKILFLALFMTTLPKHDQNLFIAALRRKLERVDA